MPQKKDKWGAKQARELFCKSANSVLLRQPEGKAPDMKVTLEIAKRIVDAAFEYYPEDESGEEEVEFPKAK